MGNRIVGAIALGEPALRGEGGPENAQLVIRIAITLEPQPETSTLTLTALRAGLLLGATAHHAAIQFGAMVSVDLTYESFTRPNVASVHIVDLPWLVTSAQVQLLEAHRHAQDAQADGQFLASLSLEVGVAWVVATWNQPINPLSSMPSDPATHASHPVPYELGMHSYLAPFWNAKVMQDLTIAVPASVWVSSVLPDFGLDRLRMIEVAMPTRDGFLPNDTIQFFETAMRQFDEGHYRESMQTCRDVRNATEQQLGATAANPVGTIVALRLGWGAGTPQEHILNAMWVALREATNEPHHIAGGPRLVEADARACPHFTAICVEYIGQLLG